MIDKIILFFLNLYIGGPQGTYQDEHGIYDIDTHLMYEYFVDVPVEEKKVVSENSGFRIVKSEKVDIPEKIIDESFSLKDNFAENLANEMGAKRMNKEFSDSCKELGKQRKPGKNIDFKEFDAQVEKILSKPRFLGYVIDIYSNCELNNYSILVDTRESFEIKKNDVFMFEDHPTLKFNILECTRQGFNHLLDITCLNLKDNIIKIKAGTRIYIKK
jgi:hypothetical protein